MGRIARLGVFFSLLLFPTWVFALNQESEPSSPSLSLPAVPFVAMSPCRLADTRGNGFVGAFGAPFMKPGNPRHFPVVGQCGIPADAEAVSFNFTVVRTVGPGYLVVHPRGTPRPEMSNLYYVANQVVASASVVELGTNGVITAVVVGKQTDLIIDITGYYAGKIVSSLNGLSGGLTLMAGSNVTITPSGNTLTLSASSTPGAQGPPGPQGAQGSVGQDGPQGVDGPSGPPGASMVFRGAWDDVNTYALDETVFFGGSSYISLTDANIDNSPDTTPLEWGLIAQKGADGADGTNGLQGPAGANGTNGVQGPAGANGTNGAQGPAGSDGADGAQGPQGITGDTGVDGPPGPQGSNGPSTYQSNHNLSGMSGNAYLSPIASGTGVPSTVEAAQNLALITRPCAMTGISVFATSPVDGATAAFYTLRVGTAFDESVGFSNLADQALGCVILPGTSSCTGGGSVPVAANDIFDIGLVVSGPGGVLPAQHHAIVVLTCE